MCSILHCSLLPATNKLLQVLLPLVDRLSTSVVSSYVLEATLKYCSGFDDQSIRLAEVAGFIVALQGFDSVSRFLGNDLASNLARLLDYNAKGCDPWAQGRLVATSMCSLVVHGNVYKNLTLMPLKSALYLRASIILQQLLRQVLKILEGSTLAPNPSRLSFCIYFLHLVTRGLPLLLTHCFSELEINRLLLCIRQLSCFELEKRIMHLLAIHQRGSPNEDMRTFTNVLKEHAVYQLHLKQ